MGRGNIAAEPQKPAPWPLCQAQKWAGPSRNRRERRIHRTALVACSRSSTYAR